MKHIRSFLLVILLCISLNPVSFGQSNNPAEQQNHSVRVVEAPKTKTLSGKHPLDSLVAFGQEEPIVLLLCGLMLLIAATTLGRKRSGNRNQTT